MSAVKKREEYYRMEYSIKVSKEDGLRGLLQMAEEIRAENGLECDETIYLSGNELSKQIDYDRKDAKQVIDGVMTEDEYLNKHVAFVSRRKGGYVMRGDDGFPDFSDKL